MCFGKIYHIDIITDGRSIGSIVVISKYTQTFPEPCSSLRDKRHQVIGHPQGQLTDAGRWMGPYGIKIAERDHPFPLCRIHGILKDILTNLFCITIGGISLFKRGLFTYRQYIRLAIYGA